MVRGWAPILPGCRWLHEPQPISDQVGAPFELGEAGDAIYIWMDEFMIRGWAPILPGCLWLHQPQPIIGQSWAPFGLGEAGDPVYIYMDVWKYDPGMGPYPPRVSLASRTPANHRSAGAFFVHGEAGDPIYICMDVWKDL